MLLYLWPVIEVASMSLQKCEASIATEVRTAYQGRGLNVHVVPVKCLYYNWACVGWVLSCIGTQDQSDAIVDLIRNINPLFGLHNLHYLSCLM